DPVVIPGKPNDDNIVYDIDPKTRKSASGWGHPVCPGKTKEIGLALPAQYPIRRRCPSLPNLEARACTGHSLRRGIRKFLPPGRLGRSSASPSYSHSFFVGLYESCAD